MTDFTPEPSDHAVVARCTFVVADVEDLWCEIVDDADARIPEGVLEGLRSQADLISEAMSQRGQEVIEDVLSGFAPGGTTDALAYGATSVTSEP